MASLGAAFDERIQNDDPVADRGEQDQPGLPEAGPLSTDGA
jgi:hypothetical protein